MLCKFTNILGVYYFIQSEFGSKCCQTLKLDYHFELNVTEFHISQTVVKP